MTFVVSNLLCYYFHFYLHFSISDIFKTFSLSVVFSNLIIICFGVVLYRVTLLMINWILRIWWKFFGYYCSNIFSAPFLFYTTRTPVSPMLYHLLYPIVAITLFLYILHFFLLLYFTLNNYCCLQVLCESSRPSTL